MKKMRDTRFAGNLSLSTRWVPHILQKKRLKKWIGSAVLGTRRYNFQPPTPTLSATMHFATDRWTDRIMPTADYSACKNIYRRRRMSRVRIGGAGGRRNARPCRMQLRSVQFSDVPWKWWW